ncbi:SCP2 sterol-binding domain-containing protein [Pseudoruegeria sp. SK021]|uniref:SCP2 sterol-binding domain-containing protein n=1 Tax=Pseudoruegeria sp. SK021 TaxID=1933035 RepID=UPI000A227DBE|nr:SCP2 sterol-binding domain-containing protein [Pseudoruegeria sp. SK021]OSP55272.1 sterol carrier family protein [Pseudoruegeria sp. SK021]
MSDVINAAVKKLRDKITGGFDGSAKFDIIGEGTIILDEAGVRAGDALTDVTLTADTETFRDILEGSLNPTTAFMSGRLKIDGDMGMAMKLGAVLA